MSSPTPPGGRARRPPPVVLDPAARRLVDASAAPPHLHDIGPVDGRLALRAAQDHAGDGPDVRTEFRAAPVGPSGLVGFQLVRPAAATGPLPAVLYLHGGRWTLGDAGTHRLLTGALAERAGAALLVPEYSRAPEARYPVAVEECYALLEWAAANAAGLGLRGDRLAVAGDCAGATMAAALALLAARRGGPRPRAQLLYYPMTDPGCGSASQRRFATGYPLTRRALHRYWREYCPDERRLAEPAAAPLRATAADLAGLPPALVVSAEADVARDEAEEYARRLRAAGVAVTCVRYLGAVHDFASLTALRDSPPARAAVRQGAAFLAAALHGGEEPGTPT
ncbi:alpha/beta hydrolase [Actinomadura parmotrematis]|uniref:Alpha/beta hydrolase n=1 Tax=Actinomadura parmotrematis TaxID=2864039 RepID=A0ABS7FK37_9ACTN|nr:alpha/beta hydrolase [Actinomadura parmotrematis]MBW8480739.1 alpha/beta hydrolase [Actinomadura parmotrematis]